MKNNLKQGFIIAIVCILLCVFGCLYYFCFREEVRKKDYISTYGYVYDYDYRSGCEYHGGIYYDKEGETCSMAIEVEYFVDGARYTVTSSNASSNPKLIGSKVEVKYDPSSPDKSFIGGKDDGDIIVLIAGCIMGIAGIAVFVDVTRKFLKSENTI